MSLPFTDCKKSTSLLAWPIPGDSVAPPPTHVAYQGERFTPTLVRRQTRVKPEAGEGGGCSGGNGGGDPPPGDGGKKKSGGKRELVRRQGREGSPGVGGKG